MHALSTWNGEHHRYPFPTYLICFRLSSAGGVILISHDEKFITTVANELWVCSDGKVSKFYGDVTAYKVSARTGAPTPSAAAFTMADVVVSSATHREQSQAEALKEISVELGVDVVCGRIIVK